MDEAIRGVIDLRPAQHVRWMGYDNGVVIVGSLGANLAVYNPTAALLWQRLATGATRDDLIEVLVRAFGVEAGRAAVDVEAILGHWRESGLLGGGAFAASASANDLPSVVETREAPNEHPPALTFALGRGRVSVHAEPAAHARLRAWLGHLMTDETGPSTRVDAGRSADGVMRLAIEGRERFCSEDENALMGGVCQAIIEAAYPEAAWTAWLHGASVARDGSAVVLVGPSGSGKSTLATHLLARGFRLLTDDLIALTAPDGLIVPWLMPLSLKPGAWAVLAAGSPDLEAAPVATFRGKTERLYMPPQSAWCEAPQPARAIFFPRYAAGAPTTLKPQRPLAALQRLVEDRCHLGYPLAIERVKAFLDWLERVPAYDLDFSDLDEAAACVEARLPH